MNVSELKSDTDFLAMSTSATYADADKVRNMNVAYNDVTRQIWESQGGWYFDDSNATTLPVAKTTLVHNQQDYELPSTAQRVRRLEIMDGNGAWVKSMAAAKERILWNALAKPGEVVVAVTAISVISLSIYTAMPEVSVT